MRYTALLCLTLTSCATSAGYKKQMESWLNAPADSLIAQYGPPTREAGLSSGGKVLEYVGGNVSTTSYYNQWSHSLQTVDSSYMCTTRFTVNASGIIEAYTFQGNACKAKE